MFSKMKVHEIVGYLKHSNLKWIIVEGITDDKTLRKFESFSGDNVFLSECGGRVKLLELFLKRTDFSNVSVAFVADRDIWVFTKVPDKYEEIIFTWGYNVENDFIHGIDIKKELADADEDFDKELDRKIDEWADKVRKLLLKENNPVIRSHQSLLDEIRTNPIQKTHGKILKGLFNRLLNSKGVNPGKFWNDHLNENHKPWMRLIQEARSRLGLI